MLVDEGLAHTLHHVLVWDPAPLRPGVVDRFGDLVPLEGHLVFVRSPLDTILDRTRRRADPPQPGAAPMAMAAFAARAIDVFARLERHERVAVRRLVVHPAEGASGIEHAAVQLVDVLCVAEPRARVHGASSAAGR